MAATSELGSRVPRKAKALLNSLVGSRTMTQEGMEWLIVATDPFHDDRVRCPGYPDLSTVNSVVQVFTTTKSFSAPAGTTTPWELHVPFIPVSPPIEALNQQPQIPSIVLNPWGLNVGAGSGIPLYSGFNAIVNAAGADWFNTPAGATLTNDSALSVPSKFMGGHSRLVSAGFEAVNTTSALYKGGSLTVYRAPSTVEHTHLTSQSNIPTTTPTPFFTQVPVESVSLPPTTQLEAATYTDSRTWSAEDGCYVIVPQSDTENPFRSLLPSDVLITKALDTASVQANKLALNTTFAFSTVQATTGLTSNHCGSGSHALPFECAGAILSGLNPNSTIQLTVRYYFERIPSTAEPDLLAMAQVPPAFDGVALEIFSRCLSAMPVGVPQNENPLGEWFSSVLDAVASVAPRVGGAITGLGNAITGIGTGAASSSSSNATAQRNMNNQQRNQQQRQLPKAPPKPLPKPPQKQQQKKKQ